MSHSECEQRLYIQYIARGIQWYTSLCLNTVAFLCTPCLQVYTFFREPASHAPCLALLRRCRCFPLLLALRELGGMVPPCAMGVAIPLPTAALGAGVKEQPHERRFLLTTLMVGLPLDKHHPARCELARSRAEVLAVAPLVGLAISDGLHNAGTTSSFLIDARPSVDSLWTSGFLLRQQASFLLGCVDLLRTAPCSLTLPRT